MTSVRTIPELELLRDGASGVCINGKWTWLRHGEVVTRKVKRLIDLGLMNAVYFAGNTAGANKTDAGRAELEKYREAVS